MLRIKDIHHVIYHHPELDAVGRFLTDFGLVVAERTERRLYLRGTGPYPYVYVAERAETPALGAIAFLVESADDLARAAELPGASGIVPLDGPGGGRRVSLHDPGGRRIDLVHGVASTTPLPLRPPLSCNNATVKRRHGDTQRPAKGPAQVFRLGHAALGVADFARSLEWYTTVLGLLPSDFIVEDGKPVGAFLRIDRGSEWVDHHTIAIFQGPEDHVHHTSFEVQDFDAQQLGHAWLAARGWRSFWDIGRHLLGSQIFDYWRDPSGNLIEHFTDGDLYNGASPTGYTPGSDDSLYQWGPEMTVGHFLRASMPD